MRTLRTWPNLRNMPKQVGQWGKSGLWEWRGMQDMRGGERSRTARNGPSESGDVGA